jgi:hypothetical protein
MRAPARVLTLTRGVQPLDQGRAHQLRAWYSRRREAERMRRALALRIEAPDMIASGRSLHTGEAANTGIVTEGQGTCRTGSEGCMPIKHHFRYIEECRRR